MPVVEYTLGQHGSQLWGRAKGVAVREQIETALADLNDGEVLGLDMCDIEVMDFSFASEVIGKLLFRIPVEYPDRYLVLMNPSNYVMENLNAALEGMKLAALVVRNSSWEIIGKFGEVDIETLRQVFQAQSTTASEMARQIGISITAMNNRLRKLVDLGLVRRDRILSPSGGEQYQYTWLVQ